MIPNNFVSLQRQRFRCEPYYFGAGGKKIGLTEEELVAAGHNDGTLWVKPEVVPKLCAAKTAMLRQGFIIVVTDAYRSRALYRKIGELRNARGMEVKGLINLENMPHATGMAVDVVLRDLEGNDIRTRDQGRDGLGSTRFGFYAGQRDDESKEFHNLQCILRDVFFGVGFEFGPRNEYWHFQLPGTLEAETF